MNRFQTVGDKFFDEISWKQCFILICIDLFDHAPTIKELSAVFGSSHQNVKQLLDKLEKLDYVILKANKSDGRSKVIYLTNKTRLFQ